jgi:hypothetical protein
VRLRTPVKGRHAQISCYLSTYNFLDCLWGPWRPHSARRSSLEGTEKYLASKLGDGSKFTASQLAEFGLMIAGARALYKSLSFGGREPTKRDAAAFCAQTLRLFGPSGTEVQNLVD